MDFVPAPHHVRCSPFPPLPPPGGQETNLCSRFFCYALSCCCCCFEAREEARRANDKACHALEMEAEVVQREAAVEVKWKEIATSRRALKQVPHHCGRVDAGALESSVTGRFGVCETSAEFRRNCSQQTRRTAEPVSESLPNTFTMRFTRVFLPMLTRPKRHMACAFRRPPREKPNAGDKQAVPPNPP